MKSRRKFPTVYELLREEPWLVRAYFSCSRRRLGHRERFVFVNVRKNGGEELILEGKNLGIIKFKLCY